MLLAVAATTQAPGAAPVVLRQHRTNRLASSPAGTLEDTRGRASSSLLCSIPSGLGAPVPPRRLARPRRRRQQQQQVKPPASSRPFSFLPYLPLLPRLLSLSTSLISLASPFSSRDPTPWTLASPILLRRCLELLRRVRVARVHPCLNLMPEEPHAELLLPAFTSASSKRQANASVPPWTEPLVRARPPLLLQASHRWIPSSSTQQASP